MLASIMASDFNFGIFESDSTLLVSDGVHSMVIAVKAEVLAEIRKVFSDANAVRSIIRKAYGEHLGKISNVDNWTVTFASGLKIDTDVVSLAPVNMLMEYRKVDSGIETTGGDLAFRKEGDLYKYVPPGRVLSKFIDVLNYINYTYIISGQEILVSYNRTRVMLPMTKTFDIEFRALIHKFVGLKADRVCSDIYDRYVESLRRPYSENRPPISEETLKNYFESKGIKITVTPSEIILNNEHI